ncbi:MAG: hypothetical protein LJE96_09805 [Deltaproteobacteria bacterium]|nr:hypothetical protein [Deltaproteobacteria bacterium]
MAGYRVYYGFESGNYVYSVDVGNQVSVIISDLEPNKIHYFSATAYDINGNESDFSEEISYMVPAVDTAPVADAGPDQTVDEGTTVTLDCSNSTDPNNDIVNYLWEQTEGPVVLLSVSENGMVTFKAPDVESDGVSLSFRLTVTDSAGISTQDDCIVNIVWVNMPPVADADLDQTVGEGDTVFLSGVNSYDLDDGIVDYLWEQTGGVPVELHNSTEMEATFVAPDTPSGDALSLTFRLTVFDFEGLKSTDTCVVNVSWTNEPPIADPGPRKANIIPAISLLLLNR